MSALLDSLHRIPVGTVEMLVPEIRDRLHQLYEQNLWYEQDLLEAIRERHTGGTFLDIGANRGNHAVYFATECKADRVIAVEPYAGEYEVLCANIEHNRLGGIIEPLRAIVHPSWASASMVSRDGTPLPDAWHWARQPVLVEGGDVPCMTLDFLVGDGWVDVVKIDVEEMGPAVLASGRGLLERCRPLVAIEAEPGEQEEVAAILEPFGYRQAGVFCWTPTFLWESS